MARTTKVWKISLPPDMAREAEAVAKREARTKSELIREALRQYLWSAKWNRLHAYGQDRARKLGLQTNDVERLVDEMRK